LLAKSQLDQGMTMKMLFGWSLFVGLVWFIAFAAVQAGVAAAPPDVANALQPVSRALQEIGWGLASFARPLLQLAIVLLILLEAGKRLGIISDQMTLASTADRILGSTSIQAVIAIIIVVAVSISALAGIGDTGVLKDLALVVVGFYFGSKAKDTDSNHPDDTGRPRVPLPAPAGLANENTPGEDEPATARQRAAGPDTGKMNVGLIDSYREFNQRRKGGPSTWRS
jgi:hypothetical protein